jgi:hypothetical protein
LPDKNIQRRCRCIAINPQDFAGKKEHLIPLKFQEVNVKINNSIAVIDITQTYYNDTETPLEVTLLLPIEEDHGLGQLTI